MSWPWCVLGDFNEITSQDEKLGGNLRPCGQMDAFKVALEDSGLVDVGWRNQKSTWSNRYHDATYTKERLDRTVVNKLWLDRLGVLGVEVLMTGSLDHLLILLNIKDNINFGGRSKYKAKWALEEDSEETIKKACQCCITDFNCWIQIQSELAHYRGILLKWSAKRSHLTKKVLDDKILQLSSLQQFDKHDIISINKLEKVIDQWLKEENMKWKQRAKKEWYKLGDKNTKFFHACASQ